MSDLRIPFIKRGKKINVYINDRKTLAYEGETVHAVLLASGYRVLRKTEKMNQLRGIFCGMGICYECLVSINDKPYQRACMRQVERNMKIDIHDILGP